MTADQGPGLRHRTVGDGKHQQYRDAHGTDQQRHIPVLDELSGDEQTGDITHGQEHDERRQAAPEQFPDADERGFRYEKTGEIAQIQDANRRGFTPRDRMRPKKYPASRRRRGMPACVRS